jgi:hypothetical protein
MSIRYGRLDDKSRTAGRDAWTAQDELACLARLKTLNREAFSKQVSIIMRDQRKYGPGVDRAALLEGVRELIGAASHPDVLPAEGK